MTRIYRAPRAPRPRRELFIGRIFRQAEEDRQRRISEEAARRPQLQEVTGIGQCPSCGSQCVTRQIKMVADGGPQAAMAVVFAALGFFACFFWLLLPLAFVLFRHNVTMLHCEACQYEWPA